MSFGTTGTQARRGSLSEQGSESSVAITVLESPFFVRWLTGLGTMSVHTKRVYEDPDSEDGTRVLVDR